MAVTRPCYSSREDVKRSLDYAETARAGAQVDRALEAAADSIEGLMHRRFYPWSGVRYFDWPADSRSWRLWLDQHDLISASAVVSGGVTLSVGDYLLRPYDGPPYTHVEINLAGSASFGGGDTHQRAIAITGVWGYGADEAAAGALAEALDASETAVDVADSSLIGVGHLLRVDDERMLVTDATMLDTGVDIDAGDSLTQQASDTAITLTSTTGAPVAGEVILIDAERMLVIDRAGVILVVKRAYDGTVLAAHAAGASIYAPRTLTVVRGAVGTMAAAHSNGAAVTRHAPPGLIRDLAVAEAESQLLLETSGYARRGSSVVDNSRNTISTSNIRSNRNEIGIGLEGIRERAYIAFGRKARIRAV